MYEVSRAGSLLLLVHLLQNGKDVLGKYVDAAVDERRDVGVGLLHVVHHGTVPLVRHHAAIIMCLLPAHSIWGKNINLCNLVLHRAHLDYVI